MRALIPPYESRSAISSLSWKAGGENPSLLRHWEDQQDLTLDAQAFSHLERECFIKQLAGLGDRTDRSELQEAIVRSVYWFADAYKDRNPTMQFVKLWSCAESFFAIEKEKEKEGVTELNTSGIAVVLTFAGFRVAEVDDYGKLKKRFKHFYGMRSQAIHRASLDHIETSDLNDFSHWIALMILSMVALSERGYKTLHQVRRGVSRLDRLSKARRESPPTTGSNSR